MQHSNFDDEIASGEELAARLQAAAPESGDTQRRCRHSLAAGETPWIFGVKSYANTCKYRERERAREIDI